MDYFMMAVLGLDFDFFRFFPNCSIYLNFIWGIVVEHLIWIFFWIFQDSVSDFDFEFD
jgi:hypothetical protein